MVNVPLLPSTSEELKKEVTEYVENCTKLNIVLTVETVEVENEELCV